MKKTKEMINEERRFLRLCCQAYKDKIHKKSEMTVNDFNRFHCVLTTLQMNDYAVYFSLKLFPDLMYQAAEENRKKTLNEDVLFSKEDNNYAYMD